MTNTELRQVIEQNNAKIKSLKAKLRAENKLKRELARTKAKNAELKAKAELKANTHTIIS